MAKGTCSIDGCEKLVECRGWCSLHYTRFRRHGDPEAGGPPKARTAIERFADMVRIVPCGGCWEWTGATGRGYGRFRVGGRNGGRQVPAHRWLYEQMVCPVPDDLELDHLCRNRNCVNPAHLEPVTGSENLRRSPLVGRWRRALAQSCAEGGEQSTSETERRTLDGGGGSVDAVAPANLGGAR